MTTATKTTKKAWFIRKTDDGFFAVTKNIDTDREAMVGPWGRSLPTVEATRQYIREMWHGGTDFPGSIFPTTEIGEPDAMLYRACLSDSF